MRRKTNDCGVRNSFGYYDSKAKEIILKRPCLKKADIDEVYSWLDEATDLKKFSVGIGIVENVVVDDSGDNLYSTARGVIRQSVTSSAAMDNEILKNMLARLKYKTNVRNLALKCYIFSDDAVLFDAFVQALRSLKSLVYLDLSGCYFSDEQLIDLAEVISKSHIAHLVWPEPRMSDMVMKQVAEKMLETRALVVMHGVPLDFQKIALDNRNWLFGFGRRPTMIGDKEAAVIHEYADSLRIAIAFEKQRLFDLEKAVEAILA